MTGAADPRVELLGLTVDRIGRDELRSALEKAIAGGERLTVTFANPNYVMVAREDPHLQKTINSFDLVLPDGWGVVAAARILGRPVPERMANDDLTDLVFGESAARGWRNYLFGNAPGVADSAAANLTRWFPGLIVCGTEHGHHAGPSGVIGAADLDRIIGEINAARPDILHVGLGTPLQQRFVIENRDRLQVPVIFTCGAYFEHLAERREYYPAWILKLRLGWLYRLLREPRRLWRRYTIELGGYVLRVLAQRIRHGRQTD